MFIVNGKSRCCNDTFTDVRFTSLLAKMFKNKKYFYVIRISISLPKILIQIGYFL